MIDRTEKILEYVKNKDVLDIGSVGQVWNNYDYCYELWNIIKKYSKIAKGIDLNKSNDKDIVQGNMEIYSFNKKFDVIVAGDVIEHVDNVGLFLDNVRKHLKDDGHFILTTGNIKSFMIHFKKESDDHVLGYTKQTLLHILKKHGFKIKEFEYTYGSRKHFNFIKKLFGFKWAMLVVCEKCS